MNSKKRGGEVSSHTVAIDTVTALTVESSSRYYADVEVRAYHLWLSREGTTIGFLNLERETATSGSTESLLWDNGGLLLCEIEIRKGCRGQGLADFLLKVAAEVLKDVIRTDGSFSEAGFKALKGLPLATKNGVPLNEPGVYFSDVSFVRNWDRKLAFARL